VITNQDSFELHGSVSLSKLRDYIRIRQESDPVLEVECIDLAPLVIHSGSCLFSVILNLYRDLELSLIKVHYLFTMLSLDACFVVEEGGRLIGRISVADLV
jgi:hypothetical protein